MRVRTSKVFIKSDDYKLKLLILRPGKREVGKLSQGILWIHGGGYVTGMAGMVYMSRA